MAPLHIDLPESEREKLAECISAGGYSSVSEYVRELIRVDHELRRTLDDIMGSRTAESLVIEGLEGGNAGEMTAADWDALRAPYQASSREA